ncbi:MAG: non-ribosomal peptide synthetase, partial [Candidatus Aminicenantes bacterium]
DHQVKIRGFRIEPGEIENRLLNVKDIKKAVVIDRLDETNRKYLCTYFVSEKTYKIAKLRGILSNDLPDYMVPSYFIQLDKLPLTPNGKLDRKALPHPEIKMEENYIAPRNEIERQLAEIWKSVLGVEKIGINDDFFTLGGDSIKSIQIASRLSKAGWRFEVKYLFKNPRISGLAPFVTKSKKESIPDQSPVIGIIPLTPIQENFFIKNKLDLHHYNQAVMLSCEERLDEEMIKVIFSRLQEHHDALRVTYKKSNESVLQENKGLEYPLSLEICDSWEENKVNEIQSGINLEKGPLMKLGLFRSDGGSRLLIVIHHLVIDGISWRILFEDIQTLYRQYIKKEPLALPLKTCSYKVWAEKLLEYANREALLNEKTYWAKLESTRVPELKKDFQGSNLVKDTEDSSLILGEEETNLLLTRVNNAFNTRINDILLAAFGLGIRETYGHNKVLVAMEGHGREEIIQHVDIKRTIGWFTAVFPVILDITHENDLSRQIMEIKENIHRIPNNGIGYGILEYLTDADNKKEIDFKLKPQIIFNYLGRFDEDIQQMTIFSLAKEFTGNTRSLKGQREYELEITGIIKQKRLVITINYSNKQYRRKTIETILTNFKEKLMRIISYCSAREEKVLTPSDFDYNKLSIEKLNSIFD